MQSHASPPVGQGVQKVHACEMNEALCAIAKEAEVLEDSHESSTGFHPACCPECTHSPGHRLADYVPLPDHVASQRRLRRL